MSKIPNRSSPGRIPLMISAYRSIGLHWSEEKWEQADIEDLIANLGANPSFDCDDLLAD